MDDQLAVGGSTDSLGRRRFIGLIGAGGAGGALLLLSADRAEGGHDATDVLHLGQENGPADATELHIPEPSGGTSFAVFTDMGTALAGRVETGIGVSGHSAGGEESDPLSHAGVEGTTFDGGIGVLGQTKTGDGIGVLGTSGSEPGVEGSSDTGPGVRGHSGEGVGVLGESDASGTSPGVFGTSANGSGVLGLSDAGAEAEVGGVSGFSDEGIGVKAQSPNGDALWVDGKSRFSTAGTGTVAEGETSEFVVNPAVTAFSHIAVTLTSDPGGSRVVQWVERNPGAGFTVHMTKAPPPRRRATDFTYLVVEPM